MVPHAGDRLVLRETDEADNPTGAYVFSEQNAPSKQAGPRVDVMDPSSTGSSWSTKALISSLSDVFLPSGYPQSVSEDYLSYQVYDSLQAFCSSIAGLLSSRAVLQGVGVGNASASPTSALLLHILQDSSGRVATIFFAHRVGTALEPECKTYRLAADVFNDIAMILDCLSPMVPAGVMRVSILSTAGVLRALCGVAGGSSKASLSAHFARWGNLAELNAKDSSQETVISLVGMLVGSVVVSHVTGFTTTWAALLILLALHLSLNYAAVRSVQMTSLNRQRANILFSALLDSDPDLDLGSLRSEGSSQRKKSKTTTTPQAWKILTPAQVAQQERIFPRDGALEWTSTPQQPRQNLGTAEIGISLSAFFKHASYSKTSSGTSFQTPIPLTQLNTLFADESYLLFLSPLSSGTTWTTPPTPKYHASILLKQGCSVQSQLKAWAHALLAARVLSEPGLSGPSKSSSPDSAVALSADNMGHIFDVVSHTLEFMNCASRFERYVSAFTGSGWGVDIAALETSLGRRVALGV